MITWKNLQINKYKTDIKLICGQYRQTQNTTTLYPKHSDVENTFRTRQKKNNQKNTGGGGN